MSFLFILTRHCAIRLNCEKKTFQLVVFEVCLICIESLTYISTFKQSTGLHVTYPHVRNPHLTIQNSYNIKSESYSGNVTQNPISHVCDTIKGNESNESNVRIFNFEIYPHFQATSIY